MKEFKRRFEELGYIFQNNEVLEDVYLFYRYYNNSANKSVSVILLEGDPGCGKTFLSEVFSKFLGQDTEYIYTQCVEETNSDRLIATYNVPAIVKGDADKSIAEGILTRSIRLANSGKKVVLAIDELDKAREALDSYFLDFFQNGKIENSDNQILSLTNDGRKNLYVILAKNNERNLLDALLRRCSVIKLPPMPPVLAYKALLRKFETSPHDPKFLNFISKVYEAIYNEQTSENGGLLSRLPSLQELITAITSDNELYQNNVSSTRRINALIRKLGKDDESRQVITDILVNKFRYRTGTSDYYNRTLDSEMSNSVDYMSAKADDSLIDSYIEKKDSGEYNYGGGNFDDPMKDIASVLDNMKDDYSLAFISEEDKEKIVELGVLTHPDSCALDILFEKIKFRGNPNSRFGFLGFEGNNFIGLIKYKGTLILVANKKYISPRLWMLSLSNIVSIIYNFNENPNLDNVYFHNFLAGNFKLAGLNVKILSKIPDLALSKMNVQNSVYTYQTTNLNVTYDDRFDITYFEYLQRYTAEPLNDVIENMCKFNPELAIPVSFINAEKFDYTYNSSLVRDYSSFQQSIKYLKSSVDDSWEVVIDDFLPMELSVYTQNVDADVDNDGIPRYVEKKVNCVFDWKTVRDKQSKKLYVYPKYKLKNGYLLYTSDKDFSDNEVFKSLTPFQKEIALMARSIYGNFVLKPSSEGKVELFSLSTIFDMGAVMGNKKKLYHNSNDITNEDEFTHYYNSISSPTVEVVAPVKELKMEL